MREAGAAATHRKRRIVSSFCGVWGAGGRVEVIYVNPVSLEYLRVLIDIG